MLKSLKSNRINVDRRGKITTGIKKVSERTGKEYPATTDYFVIDDFTELKEVYGDKPKKLVIVFPTNTIEDFFDANMVLYGSNNQMIRKCDGVECLHRIDEDLSLVGRFEEDGTIQEAESYQKKYVAGEISECCCKLMPSVIQKDGKEVKNPKLCNVAMYMKAFIVNYKTSKIISPLCYHFYSGSENTASNIYSELSKIQNMLNGRIAGLPFGLSMDMVPGKANAKIKYPIWNLQILGTMAQIEQAAESFLFDYKEILQIGTKNGKQELPEHLPIDDQGIIDSLTPEYWVGKIKELKTIEDVSKFEKAYHLELSQFGGKDEALINTALDERKATLKK